jgi:hypothetical protein
MYTSIMNSFLEGIRALRYYVESVEFANIGELDKTEMSDNITIAALMFIAKTLKLNNCNIDNSNLFEYFPEETPKELRNKIIEMIEKISDLFEVSQDGKTGNFRGVPKEIKIEYNKLDACRKQEEILYSGTLMLLITYFENTISKIFKTDFEKHPDRICLENKTISYSVLETSENIADIKDYLIDIEVTNLMYKSVSDWLEYLKKNLKLKMEYVTEKLPQLKEIIARRNIIVHNNGIVNNIYLNQIVGSDVKKGDVLTVSREYIDTAINLVETIGIAIIIEIWLKECRKNSNDLDKIYSTIYDEYLSNERWAEAKIFYGICLSSNKMQDADILLCKINRWQCYKWLNEYDKVKAEIDGLDSSALKDRYRLGILALQDKYNEFFELYETQSDIGDDELETWPLFTNIRNTDEYKNRGKNVEVLSQLADVSTEVATTKIQ